MADKMLTYIESKIMFSVKITTHFDDGSLQEKTYSIGDQIFIDYIKEKEMVSICGVLKKITSPDGVILVIDASTVDNAVVENVPVDNIRRLHDILTVHGTMTAVDGATPAPLVSENNAIFTGSIPYITAAPVGPVEGNIVAINIVPPTGIIPGVQTEVRVEGGESSFDILTSVYRCRATKVDETFKLYIKWTPETIEEIFNVIIADATLEPKPVS